MPEEPEPCFEAAVSQLEQIVASLERGEPELAAALSKYETGIRLLSRCYALLERAERSVALLTGVDAAGSPKTVAFDSSATMGVQSEKAAPAPPVQKAPATEDILEPVIAPKPARPRRTRPLAEPEADVLEPPF